jgi:hypothetical protein
MKELYEQALSQELYEGALGMTCMRELHEVRESPRGLGRSGVERMRNQAPPDRVKPLKLVHAEKDPGP